MAVLMQCLCTTSERDCSINLTNKDKALGLLSQANTFDFETICRDTFFISEIA